MISAKILKDSINSADQRITTFLLHYPRMIHSEVMTHRMASKNASSSRAIPFSRMCAMIEENPATPIIWGSHQSGMQSGVEVEDVDGAHAEWTNAMLSALQHARNLDRIGVHKSITNRLLEPFAHMTTLLTMTEFTNLYNLRASVEAQPEFAALAGMMVWQHQESVPLPLLNGDWHIPFDPRDDEHRGSNRMWLSLEQRLKIATACCARTSYLTHDGRRDVEKDVAMHDKLAKDRHWSPFEHCAYADPGVRSGNFIGWNQYRKQFRNEDGSVPQKWWAFRDEAAAREALLTERAS